MDTLRGNFADRDDLIGSEDGYDPAEDDTGREIPPDAIGQDERRMQVRAYNHWASLLDDKNFPGIEDLDPEDLEDFGPYSVLLDFTSGIENPGVSYLGEKLAQECGAEGDITQLSDVPTRSLLSRITDHYMQILANQAPIGFEAEFVNQRGQTILYRGILLPYSSDDDTIDFIYGVINWKELADQRTTDELMLEIDQALDQDIEPAPRTDEPIGDWADGPASNDDYTAPPLDDVVNFAATTGLSAVDDAAMPMPQFGGGYASLAGHGFSLAPDSWLSGYDDEEDEDYGDGEGDLDQPAYGYATEFAPLDESEMGLADWLASARDSAQAAQSSEDRSRAALYEAISRAYDFSLAAADEEQEFAELLEASGLTMQARAPLTPVVKLVFGADYDKTRLTEYAAALSHAYRIELGRGELSAYLMGAEGGLKGVVAAERRLRREENGKPAKAAAETPREKIARELRKIAPMGFETIAPEGEEFGLVVIRRLETGEVAVLGEVSGDAALIERAARKLVA